jgi:hypothetical protein
MGQAMTTFATTATTRIEHDGRTPPRWAVRLAHLTALVTLPSGLWRIFLALGFSMGMVADGEPVTVSGWEIPYIFGLSIFVESVALLTIGLVRPWGERAPRWMPLIGGRRVPARPVVAVASTGALLVALIIGYGAIGIAGGDFDGSFSGDGWTILFFACYGPLLLWAPLLAAVTFAYWKRRCRG